MGVTSLVCIDTALFGIAAGREKSHSSWFPYYFKCISVAETLIMSKRVHITTIKVLIKMDKKRNFTVKCIILLLKLSNV